METVERRTGFVAGDELPKFKLLLSCPAGLSPSEIWERRVEQNPSLFNGLKFRPKELGIIRHQTDGESIQEMVDKRVSEEMFESIIREVVEEIGVPAATLGKPIFIGISQRALNVRPTAFFFIKCSLKSEEIHKCYSSAEDSYESTQLYTMPMSDLARIMPKMPGCHQGGFALYKLMVDAVKENKQSL
ncbi:nudix hydrolase 9-like [Salvia splendens]|uniref:nudix hydrolase 9-like n=1 Tax=Salvia splendens TaxID=180675 RepID=UPI001C26EAAC|nr:nudix hydrolase 9-like [Salvia splendens]